MGKTSFDIKDPQTFVGFILGLVLTILFGLIGVIALIVVGLIYYLVTKKDMTAMLIGALVGLVVGIIINIIIGGVISLF